MTAFERSATVLSLALSAIAVSEIAERQWARLRLHRAQRRLAAAQAQVVPGQRDPDWFVQARLEIDRLTH